LVSFAIKNPSVDNYIVLLHHLWFNVCMKKYSRIKIPTIVSLVIMAAMVVAAVFFKDEFVSLMKQPEIVKNARFLHIAAATIFFSNAIVGMIWERRSLASGNKEIILYTYNTVTTLDALLSAPLIILSLIGGLSLSIRLGELMQIGWLSVSFILFLLSGIVWVISDIPTQYQVKQLIAQIRPEDKSLPGELIRIIKLRWWIGIAGVLPLAAAFVFMIYKPDMPAVASWFR
jgi:uncharacterized membrane protein